MRACACVRESERERDCACVHVCASECVFVRVSACVCERVSDVCLTPFSIRVCCCYNFFPWVSNEIIKKKIELVYDAEFIQKHNRGIVFSFK